MPKKVLQDPKSIFTKVDATRRYMSDGFGAESKESAPSVTQSVSYGEDQGGFFDWFKNLFGFGKKKEDTGSTLNESLVDSGDTTSDQQSDTTPATGTDTGTQDTNDTNPPAAPEPSAWDKPTNDADFITSIPDENVGSELYKIEKTTSRDDVKTRPVFETHSFMPREEIDGMGMLHLHSFMGLRYTKLNKKTGRLQRKRAKLGFGGSGSPLSTAGFLDDTSTSADMSTETPISMDKFNEVVASVDQVAANINSRKNGGGDISGLSGFYNVLTNNCNNFVENMARIAGATVPANLHHSILGPAGAYKQLAQAAEQGQIGDTRFFSGGGMKWGQMSEANRQNFLFQYRTEANRALSVDGIKLNSDPVFAGLIDHLVEDAQLLGHFVSGTRDHMVPESQDDMNAMNAIIDSTIRNVRAVVEYHHAKPHPRLNISALKVEALAQRVREHYQYNERGFSDLTETELVEALQKPTTAEKLASNSRSFQLTNKALFGSNNTGTVPNLLTGDSQNSPGKLILLTIGISNPVDYVESMAQRKSTREADRDMAADVAGKIRDNTDAITPVLTRFLSVRKNNSSRQCATLLASGIFDSLMMHKLSKTMTDMAAFEDRETGEVSQENREQYAAVKESFTRENSSSSATVKEAYMQIFDSAKAVEQVLYDKIEAIRQEER